MKVWVVNYNNRPSACLFGSVTAQEILDEEVRLGFVDPDDEGIEIRDDFVYIDDWLSASLEEVKSL